MPSYVNPAHDCLVVTSKLRIRVLFISLASNLKFFQET